MIFSYYTYLKKKNYNYWLLTVIHLIMKKAKYSINLIILIKIKFKNLIIINFFIKITFIIVMVNGYNIFFSYLIFSFLKKNKNFIIANNINIVIDKIIIICI